MVMHSYLYLLFLLTLRSRYTPQGVSATCYTPFGQDRNLLPSEGFNVYQPCNAGDEFSMCCALNRPSPKVQDACREDGLCLGPDSVTLWRESCTDPSWRSPSCAKICFNGLTDQGVPYSYNDLMVTECPDKSICCGNQNKTCCDKGGGVWIKSSAPTTVNPFAATSFYSTIVATIVSSIHLTSKTLSATSPTSTPTPPQLAPTSSTESKHDQSPGKIVGASIGGTCGIIIIIAVLIWYFRSRRPLLSQQRESVTPHQGPRGITQVQNFGVSGIERRQELGGLSRVELDA